MKKILSILLVVVVIGLSGCTPASQVDYDKQIKDLEERLDLFEERLDTIEFRMENITVTKGLNGQYFVYYNQPSEQINVDNFYMSTDTMLTYSQFQYLSDFNGTSAPNYIKDGLGEFIDFETVAYKLKEKYFGDTMHSQYDEFVGSGEMLLKYHITDGTYDENEMFAKTVLLFQELLKYEFYITDGTDLTIRVAWLDNGEPHILKIKIEMTYLWNDTMFTINPDAIYNEQYDIKLEVDGLSLDNIEIQTYFEDFVNNLTFDGYVLNYIEQ